jgi:hypothetical protein
MRRGGRTVISSGGMRSTWGVQPITDLQLAHPIVEALRWRKPGGTDVVAWEDYGGSGPHSH